MLVAEAISQNDLIVNPIYSGWGIATDSQLAEYENRQLQIQAELLSGLHEAENAYIQYARSLGLVDKATTQDFTAVTTTLLTQVDALELQLAEATDPLIGMNLLSQIGKITRQIISIPSTAQGYLDDILAMGGSWDNISFHV